MLLGKKTNTNTMPKELHIHNKSIAIHGKSMGSGLFMRNFNKASKTVAEKAQHLAESAQKAAVHSGDAANHTLAMLHTNTAKKLQVFKKKKAQQIADSSPAAGISTGSGLFLNDECIRPRYLNEKRKPNIRFNIE